MKTIFIALLALLSSLSLMAQPNDPVAMGMAIGAGTEENHNVTNAPILDPKKMAKDEISWELLQKYDLKTKKADKSLTERLQKPLTLTGFAIPLEFDKKEVNEFLLVPYVPSCMHVPPPPENQIVYVKLKKAEAVDNLWFPLQISGNLKIDAAKSKDALYNFEATKLKIIKE